MLPGDLLVARRYRGTIRPAYLGLGGEDLEFPARLIGLFEAFRGRRKRELDVLVEELEEGSGRDYRYVRGLATLLERRCRFEVRAAVIPADTRDALFHLAAEEGVPTTLEERSRLVEAQAAVFGVSVGELEVSLYADLEEEQVLAEFQPVDEETLVRLYNLGLTQTLLFRCTELEFTSSGNWQQIFRWIKRLGLIYSIQRQGEDYRVRVDGPVSLFRLGTRYGTSLAKLLPHIVAASEWSIDAWILRQRGDHRLLKLSLDSTRHSRHLRTEEPWSGEDYDSMVEESFAERFNALRTGWRLTREPTVLPVGRQVMIPDFLFEKSGMKVYMEVAGFWTPEYLKRKLDQLRGVEGVDMIVAADRGHACQQLDDLGRRLNVVYYKGKVPLRPVLSHLRAREGELRERHLELLRELELELEPEVEGPVVSAGQLAERLGLLEEAVLESLRQRDVPGYRLIGDTLISISTLTEVERKLSERMEKGPLSLREATELVEGVGGARPIRTLEHLGYDIRWHGINPEEAEVRRAERRLEE